MSAECQRNLLENKFCHFHNPLPWKPNFTIPFRHQGALFSTEAVKYLISSKKILIIFKESDFNDKNHWHVVNIWTNYVKLGRLVSMTTFLISLDAQGIFSKTSLISKLQWTEIFSITKVITSLTRICANKSNILGFR